MEISIKANHDFLLQITLHDSYSPPINVASEKETPTSVYAVRSAAKITVFLTIFSLCEREKKKSESSNEPVGISLALKTFVLDSMNHNESK